MSITPRDRNASTPPRPLAPRPADAHNYRRSVQELKLFAREFPDVIVTPGHDPEFFSKLGARFEKVENYNGGVRVTQPGSSVTRYSMRSTSVSGGTITRCSTWHCSGGGSCGGLLPA